MCDKSSANPRNRPEVKAGDPFFAAGEHKATPLPGEVCVGCGDRFPWSQLVEVQEENLTFFEGDLICLDCGANHGVL